MLNDFVSDISEADLIYTETLMKRGEESYEGKEIVILGKIYIFIKFNTHKN